MCQLSFQYCKRDFTGGAIDDHQAGCGFEPVHCDNKCGARIARNRLKAHRVNTCSKRMVRCQYCERSFTAETLQVGFPVQLYSAVKINVDKGCVSTVLVHVTFDQTYLDSRMEVWSFFCQITLTRGLLLLICV